MSKVTHHSSLCNIFFSDFLVTLTFLENSTTPSLNGPLSSENIRKRLRFNRLFFFIQVNITRHPDTDGGETERETGTGIERGSETGIGGGETGTESERRNARTDTGATGTEKGTGNQSSGTNGTRPCTERKTHTLVPRAESGKRTTTMSTGAPAMLDHVTRHKTLAARGGVETESANRPATRKGAGPGAETETLITTLSVRVLGVAGDAADLLNASQNEPDALDHAINPMNALETASRRLNATESTAVNARGDAGRRAHVTEGTDIGREIAMKTTITNTDAERDGRNETEEWRNTTGQLHF